MTARMRFGLLVLLLAACSSPASSSRPGVTGTITLPEASMIEVLGPGRDAQHFKCQGAGEFSELLVGSQVIARDGSGAVVGTGAVAVGESGAEKRGGPSLPYTAIPPCVMPFAIEVSDADFYTFAIAGWPVELVYSRTDLEGLGWRLELAPSD